MELVDNQTTLIEQVTKLTCLNQIIETILVEDSCGTIQVSKTIKEIDSIRHINENIDYTLKSTRLIIRANKEKNLVISDLDLNTITEDSPLCDCIARNTNLLFAKECSRLKNTIKHEIKYFKKNFLEKLFRKDNKESVLSKIEEIGTNYSWIVIPPSLLTIFDGAKTFYSSIKDNKKIIHIHGRFKNLNVYLNPDQSQQTIYFGRYDSLSLILNKKFNIEDMKTLSEFYSDAKTISIEYLFIENSPISSLTIL